MTSCKLGQIPVFCTLWDRILLNMIEPYGTLWSCKGEYRERNVKAVYKVYKKCLIYDPKYIFSSKTHLFLWARTEAEVKHYTARWAGRIKSQKFEKKHCLNVANSYLKKKTTTTENVQYTAAELKSYWSRCWQSSRMWGGKNVMTDSNGIRTKEDQESNQWETLTDHVTWKWHSRELGATVGARLK